MVSAPMMATTRCARLRLIFFVKTCASKEMCVSLFYERMLIVVFVCRVIHSF